MQISKSALLSIGLVLCCVCLTLAQGKDAPATTVQLPTGWQVFSLGEKDVFKIAMPRKPDSSTEDMSSNGFAMKASYHFADNDDIFVAVADVHNLPLTADQMTEKDRLFFFEKVRDGLVEGVKEGLKQNGMELEIQFLAQKGITFKGMTGYEQDLTLGTLKGRTRMLPRKDHIFIFLALAMPHKDEAPMGSFLDSFEFIGASRP